MLMEMDQHGLVRQCLAASCNMDLELSRAISLGRITVGQSDDWAFPIWKKCNPKL